MTADHIESKLSDETAFPSLSGASANSSNAASSKKRSSARLFGCEEPGSWSHGNVGAYEIEPVSSWSIRDVSKRRLKKVQNPVADESEYCRTALRSQVSRPVPTPCLVEGEPSRSTASVKNERSTASDQCSRRCRQGVAIQSAPHDLPVLSPEKHESSATSSCQLHADVITNELPNSYDVRM